MTNHARNGAARERQVRDYMIERGWRFIMRSAGSKGSADLLCAHPRHGAALVQVGTHASKRLGPKARARFVDDAFYCHALPLLVTVEHRPGKASKFRAWVVTFDKPAKWEVWDL